VNVSERFAVAGIARRHIRTHLAHRIRAGFGRWVLKEAANILLSEYRRIAHVVALNAAGAQTDRLKMAQKHHF